MPRMIPNAIDPDAPGSERRVYGRLRDSLPETWTVLHGRRFLIPAAGGRPSVEGEIDFLVLDPERGYVALEVKGGGVERTEDGWISENHRRQRHSIRDPGQQASRAVHQIDRYLTQQPWFRSNRARLRFGWGVVFPDVDAPPRLGADLPRELVIDACDLSDPRAAVDRVFDAQVVAGAQASAGAQQAFIEALAPCFRLVPSLASQIERERAELLRLTEEQAWVLDHLQAWPRAAIEGAAGTGKTLLAVEKARRLAADGRRVLLLCFNRPLADHLAAGAEGFDVNTFHGLCHDLSELADLAFEVPDAPREVGPFWADAAPELLVEALARLRDQRYDALIVDEGQDFRENWWIALEDCLREPGKGTLYVFYDPHQDLYGGGPPAALDVLPTHLRWNCRNTASIAEYAAGLIGAPAEIRPGTPAGVPVEEIRCSAPGDEVSALRKLLHRFVTKGRVVPDRIVVLSTRAPEKSCLWGRRLGSFELIPLDEEPSGNRIRFASLYRFKGLEADVVILCDVEPGAYTSGPNHLYVAASRARHVLAVLSLPRAEA